MDLLVGGAPIGPWGLAAVAAIFFLGGFTKGIAAFGLPLVTVPLLAQMLPFPVAVGLGMAPGFAANITQVIQTRRHFPVMREVWPLVLTFWVTIAIAVQLMERLAHETLTLIAGCVILASVGAQTVGRVPDIPDGLRRPLMVACGVFAGVVGGVTSLVAFPTVQLLVALRLPAPAFVFSVSVMLIGSVILLGGGLAVLGILGPTEFAVSAASLVPVLAGLQLGQAVGRRISRRAFERFVLALLAVGGLTLILRSL